MTYHSACASPYRSTIDWRLPNDFVSSDYHQLCSRGDDWTQNTAETMPHTITQPQWRKKAIRIPFVLTTHSDTCSDWSLNFNLTFTSEEMGLYGWFLFIMCLRAVMLLFRMDLCLCLSATDTDTFASFNQVINREFSQDALAQGYSQLVIPCWQLSQQCVCVMMTGE